MARYKAIIKYDGTHFSGMQRQKDARTVQGMIEAALRQIGWNEKSILTAGRTDAGVHASGQCISFDFEWKHSDEDLLRALNSSLDEDVAVRDIESVPKEFHPRFDAMSRSYIYRIISVSKRDPLRERYNWRVWPELNVSAMKSATDDLVGEHDFFAYGKPPKEGGSTVRQVIAANWSQTGDLLVFGIEANGFLYHMVRRIVFQLVKVGTEQLQPEVVVETLSPGDGSIIQGLAPAHGLVLESVRY